MNTKHDTNRVLLAHWTQAWTTLGRWQQLNTRLARETTARDSDWALTSGMRFRQHAAAAASAKW
jgi:hypothetical protein